MTERQREQTVRRLFYRLAGCYGAQWQNQFVGDATMAKVIKAEWTHRLRDLSAAQIARGLERLDSRPAANRRFVPGVFEFVELCQPTAEDLGIPGRWDAYREAIERAYTHPLVAATHVAIGRQPMDRMSASESQRAWAKTYDAHLDAARRGQAFNWPSGTSPAERAVGPSLPPKADPRDAAPYLARLRGAVVTP